LKELNLIKDVANTGSFQELKALVEPVGIYTANASFREKFEDIPDVKSYKDSNNMPGQGKPQEGRYIAACIPCPKEVEEILHKALYRLGR